MNPESRASVPRLHVDPSHLAAGDVRATWIYIFSHVKLRMPVALDTGSLPGTGGQGSDHRVSRLACVDLVNIGPGLGRK